MKYPIVQGKNSEETTFFPANKNTSHEPGASSWLSKVKDSLGSRSDSFLMIIPRIYGIFIFISGMQLIVLEYSYIPERAHLVKLLDVSEIQT